MTMVDDEVRLPIGWTSIELEKLVGSQGELSDGDWVESRHQNPNGGVRLIQLADVGEMAFLDKSKRYMDEATALQLNCLFLKKGDLLIARLGEVLGKTCIYPATEEKAVTVVDVLVFRTGYEEIEPRYIAYYLNSTKTRSEIEAQSSGTTRKRITGNKLKQLQVRLAPSREQIAIVSKIDELFSRIDAGETALKRAKALVERYRKSILKAAVTGELTKDWREKNKDKIEPADQLLKRILKARREAWEAAELAKMKTKGKPPKDDAWKKKYVEPAAPDTSELPELPEGWVWATPVQLEASTKNALTIGPFGSNLVVSDYRAEGVPLIFVRHIRKRDFVGSDPKFVTVNKATELESHKARAGDVLITKMGEPPGEACVYPNGCPDAVITSDCIKWTLHEMLSDREYFSLFINSNLGADQIALITTGVAQQKVSLDRFRQIGIALPSLEEIKQIVLQVGIAESQISELVSGLLDQQRVSGQLRNSILRIAFEGRLVPQIEGDEPASVLLERIRNAAPSAKPKKTKRGK